MSMYNSEAIITTDLWLTKYSHLRSR